MNEPIGPVGVLQAGAGAAHRGGHRLDRLRLADHALGDLRLHLQQLLALAFEHLVHRDAGPARHDLGDQVRRHHLLRDRAAFDSSSSIFLSLASRSGITP
jgi:hypothetical protein